MTLCYRLKDRGKQIDQNSSLTEYLKFIRSDCKDIGKVKLFHPLVTDLVLFYRLQKTSFQLQTADFSYTKTNSQIIFQNLKHHGQYHSGVDITNTQ